MAQPVSTPKIEELRFRLKTDPKNRLFYVLAEELRKLGHFTDAEQVLRGGLAHHPTYLSAWVSLGRVLREQKKNAEAAEALTKAIQLDPGNVVAARLLADAYLDMGEKVEAIKKYKLVHALLPSDEQLEELIAKLDRELNAPKSVPLSEAPEEPAFELSGTTAASEPPVTTTAAGEAVAVPPEQTDSQAAAPASEFVEPQVESQPEMEVAADSHAPVADDPSRTPASELEDTSPMPARPPQIAPVIFESPFASPDEDEPSPVAASSDAPAESSSDAPMPMSPKGSEGPALSAPLATEARETGDAEPMSRGHAESPFEEPSNYTTGALEVEAPSGIHVEQAPVSADVASEVNAFEGDQISAVESEASREPAAVTGVAEDLTNTLTMADLYAGQGLTAEARQIYESILAKNPGDESVRAKLAQLEDRTSETATTAQSDRRRIVLENWLARVGRREHGRV